MLRLEALGFERVPNQGSTFLQTPEASTGHLLHHEISSSGRFIRTDDDRPVDATRDTHIQLIILTTAADNMKNVDGPIDEFLEPIEHKADFEREAIRNQA